MRIYKIYQFSIGRFSEAWRAFDRYLITGILLQNQCFISNNAISFLENVLGIGVKSIISVQSCPLNMM